MGLATPVAIMVGSGVGAKHGILFKTAVSLEQTGKVRTVALDKTGTVTLGQPVVTDILPVEADENELLSVAASLEKNSEHPLARAILQKAGKIELLSATEFEVLPGNGLRAKINGNMCYGGKREFAEKYAHIPDDLTESIDALSAEGKTALYFVRESVLLGLIAVADVIKEDSAAAVAQLHAMGIRTVMLTGDHQKTAEAIAVKAGIGEVIAGVLPEGKERVIADLCAAQATAMVGDGINDAPALTRADIGIAIGAGTDIAIDAADVVLINSSLTDAVTAIRLSRATLLNIKENLFWAFIYNIIGIPLAAGIFIPVFGWEMNPMFGAAAMSLSSFCVVSNALRLNFFKVKPTIQRKEPENMEKVFKVEGMMCPHCEAHVKGALEALDAVESAVADHKAGQVTVTLKSELSDEVIKGTIVAQGYKVV